MKKFKITWTENDEGDLFQSSRIFEAESEDAACDMWEEQVENFVNSSGIEDCVEVISHPIENASFPVEMLDGYTYFVPVIFVARIQANKEGKKIEEVLDLYKEDSYNMISFACRNIKWDEIQRNSPARTKRVSLEDLQRAWSEVHNRGFQVQF